MERKSLKSAVIIAATAIGLGVSGLPAAASATADGLPACVKLQHSVGWTTQTLTVNNTCANRVNFFIDKEGPNSPCYSLDAGMKASYKWTKRDIYHGVYTC